MNFYLKKTKTMITHVLVAITLFFLAIARFNSILKERSEWSYKVYRFSRYAMLYNIHVDNVDANRINKLDVVISFLMIWKLNPRYFFSHKPNFKEIDELIYTNKI